MKNEDDKDLTNAIKKIAGNFNPWDIRTALWITQQALITAEISNRIANSPLITWPVSAWRYCGDLFTSGLPETKWQTAMLDQYEDSLKKTLKSMELAKIKKVNRLDLLPTLMNSGKINRNTSQEAAEIINQAAREFTNNKL